MQIGILDAMGGGNLGDAAIQDTVISNIKKRQPTANIVGFSFVPEDTLNRHDILSFPITWHVRENTNITAQGGDRSNFKSTIKVVLNRVPFLYSLSRRLVNVVREILFLARSYAVVRNLDILIVSGGGQICELWGGAWSHLYNLFKFSILTKIAGKRLLYLNVGAEPLEHWLSRFFAKFAIRYAEYVSLRDTYSQAQVRNLGIDAKTHVCADPVYALELTSYLCGCSLGISRQTVGINPVSYCDPRVWPRKEQSVYHAYLEKLSRFSMYLMEQGYRLKIFTTSPGVDKYAIFDLKQRLIKNSASSDCNGQTFDSPDAVVQEVVCDSVKEVLLEMSGCDYIVTSRYHGVIFSHLLNKPLISLNYQEKSDVAMQMAGLGTFSENIECFDSEWLIRTFNLLVRGSEIIKSQEAFAVKAYAEKLSKQFDELFSAAP